MGGKVADAWGSLCGWHRSEVGFDCVISDSMYAVLVKILIWRNSQTKICWFFRLLACNCLRLYAPCHRACCLSVTSKESSTGVLLTVLQKVTATIAPVYGFSPACGRELPQIFKGKSLKQLSIKSYLFLAPLPVQSSDKLWNFFTGAQCVYQKPGLL